MKTQERTYRGIPYNPADHERLSHASVDHTYRGRHYDAPLSHAPASRVHRGTSLPRQHLSAPPRTGRGPNQLLIL